MSMQVPIPRISAPPPRPAWWAAGHEHGPEAEPEPASVASSAYVREWKARERRREAKGAKTRRSEAH